MSAVGACLEQADTLPRAAATLCRVARGATVPPPTAVRHGHPRPDVGAEKLWAGITPAAVLARLTAGRSGA